MQLHITDLIGLYKYVYFNTYYAYIYMYIYIYKNIYMFIIYNMYYNVNYPKTVKICVWNDLDQDLNWDSYIETLYVIEHL
jgi:hypothetical protein